MISAPRLCTTCGAEIPSDAPELGCPRCLLESALNENTTKSENLVGIVGQLGDYELLEVVGRGGQGVVYRAHQKSLNRTVALKTISMGSWATEAHLKRFRREAEAAASLEHPGIVAIYEVGERDGSCYFSMRFVEGGQLDQVIKREPMSIRPATELILKVARTVHYAHEHGILHRDIKPGNILLDAKGEPLLTDFGLARLVEAESTVTQTKEVMGTPSYMAPEQAVGNNAAVSSATDVYGLGAVLYQLLTGHPPFAGGTTYETIKLVLDTEPRQPRLLNPKIDRDLSTICLKCLEKDPKRRYASALALAEDLEHWLKHEPILARRTGFFARARKWVRRNPSTAILVTLLVALAAASGGVVWNRVFAVPMAKSVAVLPFENLSNDPDNAYFASGIQDEILTRLATVADLKVISRTSTQRYQSRPRNLREIAKELGVANILEGSVQKAANHVHVNVQLINAQTDSHLWADTYDRKITDIFGIEAEVAKSIADSLQATLSPQEKASVETKPTTNADAYVLYLRARDYQTRPDNLLQDFKSAINLYDHAIKLDPNFALAHARLSATANLVYHFYEPTEIWKQKAQIEALESLRLQPNLGEGHLALGLYHYYVEGDYDAALRELALAAKALPNDGDVSHYIAAVRRRADHLTDAIAAYRRAEEIDPRNPITLYDASQTYFGLRDWRAAAERMDRVLALFPDSFNVKLQRAYIEFFWKGSTAPIKAALQSLPPNLDPDGVITFARCDVSLMDRDADAAEKALANSPLDTITSQTGVPLPKTYLQACVDLLRGDTAKAQAEFEVARPAIEKLVTESPQNGTRRAQLGLLYAFLGREEDALREGKRAMELVPITQDLIEGAVVEVFYALICARLQLADEAITRIGRLLATPFAADYADNSITVSDLRQRWEWDPLRSDPRFQKLCEDKQP
jgi:TolB-like protein/Flp pilus assembly protein TadD